MTMQDYMNRKFKVNEGSEAFRLMCRCVDELVRRGHAPLAINYASMGFDEVEIGDHYISVEEVHRHNGTEQNVTVRLCVFEKDGKHTARRVFMVKVPKGASDKVLANRVTQVIENL